MQRNTHVLHVLCVVARKLVESCTYLRQDYTLERYSYYNYLNHSYYVSDGMRDSYLKEILNIGHILFLNADGQCCLDERLSVRTASFIYLS